MAKNLASKCKLCRRAGEKLFLKGSRCASSKCAMVRKAYPPGMHGLNQKRGLSEYGKQLAEKQKLKRMYGLSERQLKRYFKKAEKQKGVLGENLLALLETRLDNIVYQLAWANSRSQARQLVSHKIFMVNGKPLNVPSANLKVGDEITVKKNKENSSWAKNLKMILKKRKEDCPEWLLINLTDGIQGKILAPPTRGERNVSFDLSAVIEFYSR